jgi:hypothetical protein
MGLNRKTSKYLNLASHGSFLHNTAKTGRELLLNISQATPPLEAKPLEFSEEESYIVQLETPIDPSQSSAISNPNEGEILDSQWTNGAFLKKTMKELVSVVSHEWLEEAKISSDIIHLDSPSTTNLCQIHREPFSALYNLVVGVNIISASFAHDLLEHTPLTPTTKLLKSPSGHIIPSLGILYVLPI